MKRISLLVLSMFIMEAVLFTSNVEAKSKLEKAVSYAINVAKNNRNGYSMPRRNMRNKKGGREYDCSSLVVSAYKAGGFKKLKMCTTRNQVSIFKKAGFRYIPKCKLNNFKNSKKLKRGDILWRNGHTEIYIGKNKCVGAHRDYDRRAGDSSGKEISVTKYYNLNWSGILRKK